MSFVYKSSVHEFALFLIYNLSIYEKYKIIKFKMWRRIWSFICCCSMLLAKNTLVLPLLFFFFFFFFPNLIFDRQFTICVKCRLCSWTPLHSCSATPISRSTLVLWASPRSLLALYACLMSLFARAPLLSHARTPRLSHESLLAKVFVDILIECTKVLHFVSSMLLCGCFCFSFNV